MKYVAHIITAEADLGSPAVAVLTADEDGLGADLIEDYWLPEGADPIVVLADNGWSPAGEIDRTGPYEMLDVEPQDWDFLLAHLAHMRQMTHKAYRIMLLDLKERGLTSSSGYLSC